MDTDDKVKAILNLPGSKAHYRERARRSNGKLQKNAAPKPKRGSWNDAKKLHRRLRFRLKKNGDGKQDKSLLKIISACKVGRRCADAACPKCNYAVQGVLNDLHLDMREGCIVFDKCVTIIPALIIKPNDCRGRGASEAAAKVDKFREWLDDAFDVSGVTHVIGAIDFNTNEFPPESKFKEHCRPHFHGLAFANQLNAGDKRLRGEFRKRGSVNKPVQVDPFDGADNWCHYMIKIPNSRLLRKRDPDTGNWARPTYKELKVDQQLQQALVLHEIGWAGRLYLRGVDLIEGRKGWRLVLTDFAPEVQKNGR